MREAREGLSHSQRIIADAEDLQVVRRGQPAARILPVTPPRRPSALEAFLEAQMLQRLPSEAPLAELHGERG